MSLKHVFCLNGCGYLHDIFQKKNTLVARIKIFNGYDASNTQADDVWIDCEVLNAVHQARLNKLIDLVRDGSPIMLTFRAQYGRLIDAFSGQTRDDPNHMVMLQGKLKWLDDCYANGEMVEERSSPLRAAA